MSAPPNLFQDPSNSCRSLSHDLGVSPRFFREPYRKKKNWARARNKAQKLALVTNSIQPPWEQEATRVCEVLTEGRWPPSPTPRHEKPSPNFQNITAGSIHLTPGFKAFWSLPCSWNFPLLSWASASAVQGLRLLEFLEVPHNSDRRPLTAQASRRRTCLF